MKIFLNLQLIFVMIFALKMGCCNMLENTSEINSIDLAHWMKNLDPELKNIPFIKLAIPGSHNSMTYNIVGTNKIGPDAANILKAVKLLANDKMVQWTKNQKLNTTEQLLAGIRFFDLRVVKNNATNKFYYTHGIYSGEVTGPLNEVKDFVDTHPEEVVILYFQKFYEFRRNDHNIFMEKLRDLFEKRLIPQPWYNLENMTISSLSMFNKSIIIVYNAAVLTIYPIWPGDMVAAPWPNQQSSADLMQFLQNTEESPGHIFVHQAVLTPTLYFLAFRLGSNLQEACARPVLTDVVPKLGEKLHTQINVVIADYIDLENNLFPRTIIALNNKYKRNNFVG